MLVFFVTFLSMNAFERDMNEGMIILFCTSLYTNLVLYTRISIDKDHTVTQCVAGFLLGTLLSSFTYRNVYPVIKSLSQLDYIIDDD